MNGNGTYLVFFSNCLIFFLAFVFAYVLALVEMDFYNFIWMREVHGYLTHSTRKICILIKLKHNADPSEWHSISFAYSHY